MSNHIDDAIPIEGWPRSKPIPLRAPKWINSALIVKARSEETGPFTVEEYFNGDLVVCDTNLVSVARFDSAYREFAEEMKDRLNFRALVTKLNASACPECGKQPISITKRAGEPTEYEHAFGIVHFDHTKRLLEGS